MKEEIKKFILEVFIIFIICMLFIVFVNYSVDVTGALNPNYDNEVKEILEGKTIKLPSNYNERYFQEKVILNMKNIPNTIVIGSSRGMYIGQDITGNKNIYNHCVSGGDLIDYFAILGLYEDKFDKFPKNIIMEISPWVFNIFAVEGRWKNTQDYKKSAKNLYKKITCKELVSKNNYENQIFNVAYFQYNVEQLFNNCVNYFFNKNNTSGFIEYSDGTIRYPDNKEYESSERTRKVKVYSGALTYHQLDLMKELDIKKINDFEKLTEYLLSKDVKITLFLSPFSETQCEYSIDKKLNPGINLVYNYLKEFANRYNLIIVGSYDTRDYNLHDNRYIDFMHIDKKGIKVVWDFNQ